VALERDAQGRTSWPTPEPATADTPRAAPETKVLSLPRVDRLAINGGRVDYLDALLPADLQIGIASDEAGMKLDGKGKLRGAPTTLALALGSPLLLLQADAPYPLKGQMMLGDVRLALDGAVRHPLALDGIAIALDLESQDPHGLLALAGRPTDQPLPPLQARARLTGDEGTFALEDLDLAWGQRRLEGKLGYASRATPPRLDGELHAPMLDIAQLQPLASTTAPPAATPEAGGLDGLLANDAHLLLTVDAARLPEQVRLGRIEADLVLAAKRLTVELRQAGLPSGQLSGRIETAPLDQGLEAEISLAAKQLDLAPLAGTGKAFAGVIDGTLEGTLKGTDLEQLMAESTLELKGTADGLRLPQLGDRVSGLSLEAALAPGGEQPVSIRADGKLGEQKLHLDARGGALAKLMAEKIVYPLQLNASLGPSHAALDGTFAWPLDAGGLDMAVDAEGQEVNLASFLGQDGPVGGIVSGKVEGRLVGGTPADILAKSHLDAKGRVKKLRLPQLEDRLPEARFEAKLAPEEKQPIEVKLDGAVGQRQLHLDVTGGKPGVFLGGKGDYPLAVKAALGKTKASVDGTVGWPLEQGGVDLAMTVEGPDPGDITSLLKLPDIKLPPYRLAGQVVKDGVNWRFQKVDGKVGDSDVAGELALGLDGARPMLSGSLHSKVLDIDDLGGLVGAEPATGPGETASSQQKAEAKTEAKDDEVIPDEKIDPSRWQKLDVKMDLTADKVKAGRIPLDAFKMTVVMDAGRLRVEPLLLRLGEGRIEGHVAVDTQKQPAVADLDLDLRQLSVARLLNRLNVDTADFGTLSGSARGGVGIGGRGLSLKEILSHADGQVTLLMTGGAINRTIVAGLGFDVIDLFGSLVGAAPQQVALHCTLADLAIKDGIVTTRSLVVTTDIADLFGEGTVDLGSERIQLDLLARAEGQPLSNGRTGISITGKLAEPDISFSAGRLLARGAAAATFGLLLKPFAAVASAVSGGGAKTANACTDLLKSGAAPAGGG
jgi:uncharacterized protein involved in outer membrane biogenesis